MEAHSKANHRDQLMERRRKLHELVAAGNTVNGIPELLAVVDAALERIETGCYGACQTCGGAQIADDVTIMAVRIPGYSVNQLLAGRPISWMMALTRGWSRRLANWGLHMA